MFSSKLFLPFIGMITLVAVIILSYTNGGMFMNQLLASAFIISTILLVRAMNESR